MESIINFLTQLDFSAWITAIVALLTAIMLIAQLIPGPEPERTLQKILDIIKKFSKK